MHGPVTTEMTQRQFLTPSSIAASSRAGFSLRCGADAPAVIPLARITRWGHDASDFFVEVEAAAVDEPITSRTEGVIRIVVATRDGARLATVLRNHAIRALRAIDAAAAAATGPRVSRRRSAVDEALKELGVKSVGHRLKIFAALQ